MKKPCCLPSVNGRGEISATHYRCKKLLELTGEKVGTLQLYCDNCTDEQCHKFLLNHIAASMLIRDTDLYKYAKLLKDMDSNDRAKRALLKCMERNIKPDEVYAAAKKLNLE